MFLQTAVLDSSIVHTDTFSMTKLHRDIAMRLLECVQDEEFTDQATVKVDTVVQTCPNE